MNRYHAVAILYAIVVFALIIAKLSGYLHASWPIVLIPFWLPVVLIVVVALAGIALFGAASSGGRNPFQ
jgi:hypothetical protein